MLLAAGKHQAFRTPRPGVLRPAWPGPLRAAGWIRKRRAKRRLGQPEAAYSRHAPGCRHRGQLSRSRSGPGPGARLAPVAPAAPNPTAGILAQGGGNVALPARAAKQGTLAQALCGRSSKSSSRFQVRKSNRAVARGQPAIRGTSRGGDASLALDGSLDSSSHTPVKRGAEVLGTAGWGRLLQSVEAPVARPGLSPKQQTGACQCQTERAYREPES